jgi:hypothetical protein
VIVATPIAVVIIVCLLFYFKKRPLNKESISTY